VISSSLSMWSGSAGKKKRNAVNKFSAMVEVSKVDNSGLALIGRLV
jgi:hypothetical protein